MYTPVIKFRCSFVCFFQALSCLSSGRPSALSFLVWSVLKILLVKMNASVLPFYRFQRNQLKEMQQQIVRNLIVLKRMSMLQLTMEHHQVTRDCLITPTFQLHTPLSLSKQTLILCIILKIKMSIVSKIFSADFLCVVGDLKVIKLYWKCNQTTIFGSRNWHWFYISFK